MSEPFEAATAPDLVLRPKRLSQLGYFAICLAFTIGGALMIADGQWAGWFVAGFFGLGVVALPLTILPGASYLRLTPQGFTVCSMYRHHHFKWAEIEPCFPGVVSKRKMVLFDLAEPGRFPRGRAVARLLTGAEAGLSDTYGMTAEDLAALMNRWRDHALSTDGMAAPTAPAPLSATEIAERLPVWEAISELWLDTEHEESDLEYIARRLAESGYSLDELEDIYRVEVAPVVHGNLRQVAGEWIGFGPEWLKDAVLRHLADPHHRARALRRQATTTKFVAEDWQRVKRHITDLRDSGRKA